MITDWAIIFLIGSAFIISGVLLFVISKKLEALYDGTPRHEKIKEGAYECAAQITWFLAVFFIWLGTVAITIGYVGLVAASMIAIFGG